MNVPGAFSSFFSHVTRKQEAAMSKWVVRVGAIGAVAIGLVITACGPKKGSTDSAKANPKPNAASKDVGGPAPVPGQLTVTGLKISEKETSTVVRIEASASPTDNYTVFKLTDPMRVVVDIQNSAMGEVGGPYKVGNGTVTDVSSSYFEDEGNKVTRVMIGLDKIVEYTVSVDGNAILVEVPREGAMPAVAEMGTGTGGSTSVAMAETSAPAAKPSPAPTSSEVALPTDETPLPAESVAAATPAPAMPEATATPVPAATEAPLFAEGAATPAPAEPMPTPEQSSIAEATPAPASTPEMTAPVTEPTMAEAAPTPAPKGKKGKHPKEPKPTRVASAAPVSSNGLVKMTALDWNNKEPNKSRIVIRTAAPVQYEELAPENNTVVLELKGVRVPKSLERALDTSEFKSAVKLISSYQSGDNARVVVQLRENVNHTVTQDGNAFNFDFDRPTGMTGPEVASAAPATAAPAMPATAAGTGEAQTFPEAQPATATEPAENSEMEEAAPAVMAAAPVPAANGYRPAETFFADPTFAKDTGRPMAAAGSALAGLQAGSEMENGPSKVYTGRKLNMDFKNADIHNVLRIIANVSKLNIIASDAVSGTVTVRLINVPWDQALDIILQAKQLDLQRQGNIIRIDTLANFGKEREERKKAKDGLADLLPVHTLLLPVSYATANDMSARVRPFLSKQGSVTVDERTNTVLVQDHAEQLERIRELSHTLDTATPQVLVEARLVEATYSFDRTIGIQWGGAFNPNPTSLFFPNTVGVRGGNADLATGLRGSPDDNLAINLPGPSVSSIALFTGSLGGGLNLDARLGALESTSDIKVVSSPRIATLDNKTAKISQGQKIPYVTASAQGTQTQFVDATLSLDVTPHITQNKSVFMTVTVHNNGVGSIAVNGQPSINIAEATTEILSRDGETSVIGGVFVVNKSESASGLPGLYKIPFLGFLFRTTNRSENRQELLVFLTPHIIARSIVAEK